jgi:hypothetical protein
MIWLFGEVWLLVLAGFGIGVATGWWIWKK